MAAAKKEKKPIKIGASSRHITFDIYGFSAAGEDKASRDIVGGLTDVTHYARVNVTECF
jgi:hypothetical protein